MIGSAFTGGSLPVERFHPFTCPSRGDGNHVERPGKDLGELVTCGDCMCCLDCDYVQLPYGMQLMATLRPSDHPTTTDGVADMVWAAALAEFPKLGRNDRRYRRARTLVTAVVRGKCEWYEREGFADLYYAGFNPDRKRLATASAPYVESAVGSVIAGWLAAIALRLLWGWLIDWAADYVLDWLLSGKSSGYTAACQARELKRRLAH